MYIDGKIQGFNRMILLTDLFAKLNISVFAPFLRSLSY